MEPYPQVSISGEEILRGSQKILAALEDERPEVAIACCALLAYGLVRDTPMNTEQAQEILNRFTTFALAGEEGVQ